MGYVKVANLKGPKGNGVGNPRIIGDNLVMDTFDGTEVSEEGKVVGNVRGPVGPKGPMPSLQVSAAAGGEDLDPVAVVSDTPTGYSVELLNTKGRTPKVGASVTTGAPGTEASVAVTNTDEGADFEFTVPRGDRGEIGPVGPKGPMPELRASVPDNGGSPTAAPSVRVVDTDGGYALEFLDLKGPVGPVPRIEMQPPLNLAHGSTPTVSFYEASPGVYRLQLGLVQGEPGKASGAISDEATDYQTAWSSLFTQEQIQKAVDAIIDDGTVAALTGWSSQKIRAEIDRAVVKTLPWDAVTGKPATFPPASHSHSWDEITGKPKKFAPEAHDHAWGDITGKPATFPPASHKHSATDITSGVLSKSRLPSASTSGPGIVQLATAAEVEAGTSTTAVPTVADVASYVTAHAPTLIGPVLLRKIVQWANADIYVTRFGPLVIATGTLSGTANHTPPDGYRIAIFDGAPEGLAPKDPVFGHGGLSFGKWGERPLQWGPDGLTLMKGINSTGSWSLNVYGFWTV